MVRFSILIMSIVLLTGNIPVEQQVCRKQVLWAEKKYGIPAGLLLTLSTLDKEKSDLADWPWVIQMAGEGYTFKNKATAVKAVHQQLDRGVVDLEIGCAQLNFKEHGTEFPSVSHMMDPRRNIEYAAQLLVKLYKIHGSWAKALENYRTSSTPRHKVYTQWRKTQREIKKTPELNSPKKPEKIEPVSQPIAAVRRPHFFTP
jgi:hypothetical protein